MKAQSDCKSHAEMTWPVTVTECKIRDSGFKEVLTKLMIHLLRGVSCVLQVVGNYSGLVLILTVLGVSANNYIL